MCTDSVSSTSSSSSSTHDHYPTTHFTNDTDIDGMDAVEAAELSSNDGSVISNASTFNIKRSSHLNVAQRALILFTTDTATTATSIITTTTTTTLDCQACLTDSGSFFFLFFLLPLFPFSSHLQAWRSPRRISAGGSKRTTWRCLRAPSLKDTESESVKRPLAC